jgi:DNA repair and recombination RAD54-like protein
LFICLNFGLNDMYKKKLVCYYVQIGSLGTNEVKPENMGNRCEHDTRLDDEIGVYCRWCGVVFTEIKYISPLVVSTVSY